MISVGKVKESHRLPLLLAGFPSLQGTQRGQGTVGAGVEAGAIHRSLSARQLRVVIVQLIRPKSYRGYGRRGKRAQWGQLDALHRRQLACVRVQRVSFSRSVRSCNLPICQLDMRFICIC